MISISPNGSSFGMVAGMVYMPFFILAKLLNSSDTVANMILKEIESKDCPDLLHF